MKTKYATHIGKRFGLLTVTLVDARDSKHVKFACVCDCGATCFPRTDHVLSGMTKSCGCIRVENTRRMKTTHGMARVGKVTPEFRSWWSAIDRCENPNCNGYKNWGGRGIKFCTEWRNSFEAFFAYMGKCPPRMTLGRINNDGNYEPGNCQWETRKQQANNTRRSLKNRKPLVA